MNDLPDYQKMKLIILLQNLRDLCRQTHIKIKVTKLEMCYGEPIGDLKFGNDLLTLVWDDTY